MGTTQFMNAKLAADKPIFTRAKINHIPPHPVTHLIASNQRIILVLANKTIQRVDQTRPEDNLEVIDISKMIPKSKVNLQKKSFPRKKLIKMKGVLHCVAGM